MAVKKPAASPEANRSTKQNGHADPADPSPQPSGEWVVLEPAPSPAGNAAPESDPSAHPSTWMKDADAPNCLGCGARFGMFKRRHHCRKCGRIFCENCCPLLRLASNNRQCLDCRAQSQVAARCDLEGAETAQRRLVAQGGCDKQTALLLEALNDFEPTERQILHRARETQIAKVLTIFLEHRQKIRDAEAAAARRVIAQEVKSQQAEVLDKWATVTGPRSGSLNLTVARAQGLVPPRLLLTTNSACLVQYHFRDANRPPVEFETRVVKGDASPEYDFECYCSIEDDTLPVLFFIRDYSVGYPLRIASSRLNLRGAYKNLVRTVTKEGVYVEKGHAILDCWKHNEVLPDTFVTVHWTLELREINKTAFCPDCGRLEFKCECEPSVRDARREADAKKLEERLAAQMEAKEKREEEERRKEQQEAEQRRIAAEKVFRKGVAALEVEMKNAQLEICLEERRVWERVDKAIREDRHISRLKAEQQAEEKRLIAACLGLQQKNASILLRTSYGTWKSAVNVKKEIRRHTEEDAAAAAVITERRRADNQAKAQAEADKRQVDKENREAQYQEDKRDPGQHMVNGVRQQGRPRPEVHHDEQQSQPPPKEAKTAAGCCTIS